MFYYIAHDCPEPSGSMILLPHLPKQLELQMWVTRPGTILHVCFFVSVCAHVHKHEHICAYVYSGVKGQRLSGIFTNVRHRFWFFFLSLLLFVYSFIFETGSLTDPGACWTGYISWPSGSGDLPVFTSLLLESQMHSPVSSLSAFMASTVPGDLMFQPQHNIFIHI